MSIQSRIRRLEQQLPQRPAGGREIVDHDAAAELQALIPADLDPTLPLARHLWCASLTNAELNNARRLCDRALGLRSDPGLDEREDGRDLERIARLERELKEPRLARGSAGLRSVIVTPLPRAEGDSI